MKFPFLTTIFLLYICIVVDLAMKLICCLTDWGGYSCLGILMTTFNSEEITLWCASVGRGGVYLSLSANDNIEQWRDHSVLCQIYGGYIVRCTWCHTDISSYLPISWGVTLTFPYIFLLLDCFKFPLIDHIEKQRDHSELWQFQMGGIS